MTRSPLPFVLAGDSAKLELTEHHLDSDQARIAARFWAGKYQGSSAKAACVERIAAVWRDPKRVEQVLAALRPEERAVLRVVKRFGGAVSGALLQQELRARDLLPVEDPNAPVRFRRHDLSSDPVLALCERLVLVKRPGYYSYYRYGPFKEYPDVFLPSQLAPLIEPAAPLTWRPAIASVGVPEATAARAAAEMLVDLEQTARALESCGRWRINQGGGLPATMRKRLEKLRPKVASDPFEPPDRTALDYSLLCALGAVEADGVDAWLDRERAGALFHQPAEVQTSGWVRAWLSLRLWQDGVGAVPERDNYSNPTRIEPKKLQQGREMLAWALTRIAHSEGVDWLDLESFLLDLHAAAGERGLSFYWHKFSWQPHFSSAARKEEIKAGPERMRAFWMDQEAVWAANALLSTLVHLGVVERGRIGDARSGRWCFRLTAVGKAVFGAPEIAFRRTAGDDRCLTVQPNHEVLLYLDAADGEAVTTLGRIAARQTASGLVQTFKLTRDSVYGALEAGMAPAAIGAFLSSKSRSGLPANVAQSLAEWSRKRDALVVRTGVALQFRPHEKQHRGQALGPHLFLASPRAASQEAKGLGAGAEAKAPRKDWTVDAQGVVAPRAPMSIVGKARLRRFAQLDEGAWIISAESVGAARKLGISGDQILDWLAAHATNEVPKLLAVAIRNWASGRGRAFLGDVLLLQVGDASASDALLGSERLRPFLKGTLAPGVFVVTDEGRQEAKKLLRELGFGLDAECKTGPATPAERVDDLGEDLDRRAAKLLRLR